MASGCHLQPIAVVLTKAMERAESARPAPMQRSRASLWTPSACAQAGGAALQTPMAAMVMPSSCMSVLQSCQDMMLQTATGHACTGSHPHPSTATASSPAGLLQQGSRATRHWTRLRRHARTSRGAVAHLMKPGRAQGARLRQAVRTALVCTAAWQDAMQSYMLFMYAGRCTGRIAAARTRSCCAVSCWTAHWRHA
jgi:hypothetical protein